MTGKELIDEFSFLVLTTRQSIDSQLSADQLCKILDDTHTMILNQAHVAPCQHTGSRYRKDGQELEHCGVCGRQVAEYYSDSLADA